MKSYKLCLIRVEGCKYLSAILLALSILTQSCRFQWASLQIKHLLALKLGRDIQERLGKLPKDLKLAYDEIWAEIQRKEGSEPEIAARAIQWVMACKPLRPEVLVAAAHQDPDNDEPVDIGDADIDLILGACHNLLIWDENQNVCRFAHLSIQEYFEHHHWTPGEANTLVTKVCLRIMNHPEYRNIYQQCSELDNVNEDTGSIGSTGSVSWVTTTDSLPHGLPLWHYAVKAWPGHLQTHDKNSIDNQVSTLFHKFVGSINDTSVAYRDWVENYSGPGSDHMYPSDSAAFSLCYFGFENVASELWRIGIGNLDQRNCNDDSLLVLATYGGSVTTAQRLLALGADVNGPRGMMVIRRFW